MDEDSSVDDIEHIGEGNDDNEEEEDEDIEGEEEG